MPENQRDPPDQTVYDRHTCSPELLPEIRRCFLVKVA